MKLLPDTYHLNVRMHTYTLTIHSLTLRIEGIIGHSQFSPLFKINLEAVTPLVEMTCSGVTL